MHPWLEKLYCMHPLFRLSHTTFTSPFVTQFIQNKCSLWNLLFCNKKINFFDVLADIEHKEELRFLLKLAWFVSGCWTSLLSVYVHALSTFLKTEVSWPLKQGWPHTRWCSDFSFTLKNVGENRCEDSFNIIVYVFNIIILQMDTQDDSTRMWDQPKCETVCLLFVVTISQLLWWGDTFRSALVGYCWHFVRGSHILDKLAGTNGMLKFHNQSKTGNKGEVAFRHFILKVHVRVLLAKLLVSQWDFIQFNSIYASTVLYLPLSPSVS